MKIDSYDYDWFTFGRTEEEAELNPQYFADIWTQEDAYKAACFEADRRNGQYYVYGSKDDQLTILAIF